MLDLLYEYKETLRKTNREKYNVVTHGFEQEKTEDITKYNAMINDLQYVIEWLSYGREPGKLRGTDKRDVYSLLMDEDALSVLGDALPSESVPANISMKDKDRIEDALSALTKKERDAYVLHHGEQLSYERIADLMNVKKSTIQGHMERAEKKVNDQIEQSLFQLT